MPLEYLIFLTLFTPALVGVLNLIFHKNANVRDGVTLLGALATCLLYTSDAADD